MPEDIQQEEFETAFDDFRTYYKEHCKDKTKPYAGIEALMQKLQAEGYKLAVVSNKNDEAVKEIIPYYFGEIFDIAVGAKENIAKKPAPDSTFFVLEQLGVAKENAIFIGDSQVDVKTAENAGIEGIFVTWGFRTKEELEEAGAKEFAVDTVQLYDKLNTKQTI